MAQLLAIGAKCLAGARYLLAHWALYLLESNLYISRVQNRLNFLKELEKHIKVLLFIDHQSLA